jgi:hypothetical protein
MKRNLSLHACVLITVLAPIILSGASIKRSGTNPGRNIKLNGQSIRPGGRNAGQAVLHGKALPVRVVGSAPGEFQGAQDLSAISRLPFQVETFPYSSAFPVVLENGNIMVVYVSDYENTIYFSQSPDSGATWTQPSAVMTAAEESIDMLTGLRTAQGRIIAVWRALAGGFKLSMCRSDDDGVSWSEPVSAVETGLLYNPMLSQTADGRIWFFYTSTEDWVIREVRYRTSDDNGDSWSADRIFPAEGFWSSEVTLFSEPGSPVFAVYTDGIIDNTHLYERVSSDGGDTWSARTLITDSLSCADNPRVVRGEKETSLIYTDRIKYRQDSNYHYYESIVNTMTVPLKGDPWGPPVPVTGYAGQNGVAGACLFNGRPFVVFVSDRWQFKQQLWYGLAGFSEDINPPPAFFGLKTPLIRPNRIFSILAFTGDETGIAGVTLSYERDGIPLGSVPMSDDGLHDDSTAGDGIWGAAVGPFDAGEVIDCRFDVRDVHSNEISVDGYEIDIPLIHDAGGLVLRLFDNSAMADQDDETVSAYWPRENSQGYLALGGLWMGTKVGGEKRVMNIDWSEGDWRRTEGTKVAFSADASGQEGDMTYDDLSAWSGPIGLRVHQSSRQWSADSRDDFILFRYTVRNLGEHGDLDSLFTGLWLDADAGWDDWTNNLAGYDSGRNLLYVYNGSNEPEGYVGVRLLGRGAVSHGGGAYSDEQPGGALEDDEARYDFMTDGTVDLPPDTADYRILLTAPPFSLASGDSFSVAFGLVLGNGLDGLRAKADTLEAVYERLTSTGAVNRESGASIPEACELRQNYPNPFNSSTSLEFVLPDDRNVVLKVYNTRGAEVAVLADRPMKAGRHAVRWDASGQGSGIYFCRLQAGEISMTRKLLLLK